MPKAKKPNSTPIYNDVIKSRNAVWPTQQDTRKATPPKGKKQK